MASSVSAAEVKKIVFACEAGAGTSLIGANQLKKKLKAAGLQVEVKHSPLHALSEDAQVVVVHVGLAGQARSHAPWAVVLSFQTFVGNPVYDQIVEALREGRDIVETN